MPPAELPNYSKLKHWLLSQNDVEDFPFLDVGLAIGSLGNAPALVSATLLRRDHGCRGPFALLIVCAGSACWFLDLMSDNLEEPEDLLHFGFANLNWSVQLDGGDGEKIRIEYAPVRHFDWSSTETTLALVTSLNHRIDPARGLVDIDLEWRDMSPLSNDK